MSEHQGFRPKARLPRGLRDRDESELAAEHRMLETIGRVYASYGFQALETASLEYADALGKFLPDQDRPNEGVFSFEDDDGQWLSLRYDLTAPLARYVAENFQALPKPFRRYQMGRVWRNEKPGPGRFREFPQFDADTVGSASPAADAELLMMLCDTLEALGLGRGAYHVRVNNRKLLDGVLEAAGVAIGDRARRGTVLRAIDKLDRLGAGGVSALLGAGRKDESGDFTKGAELSSDQIAKVMAFATPEAGAGAMDQVALAVAGSAAGEQGVAELRQIFALVRGCGYDETRIAFDSGIVRGLDYYTGAVFEAQLTAPVTNEAGEDVVFGSIGSGGRYDDLVARFTGQSVPAVGVSIGVSRLFSALRSRSGGFSAAPLIVVMVLDRAAIAESLALARELRTAGFRAEAYIGESGMKAQLKYADRRGAAIAIMEGADEKARGEVTLKDLALGAELAKSVTERADWVSARPAQRAVARASLVEELRSMLGQSGA
jgi:histidyl-tRNA synthetase